MIVKIWVLLVCRLCFFENQRGNEAAPPRHISRDFRFLLDPYHILRLGTILRFFYGSRARDSFSLFTPTKFLPRSTERRFLRTLQRRRTGILHACKAGSWKQPILGTFTLSLIKKTVWIIIASHHILLFQTKYHSNTRFHHGKDTFQEKCKGTQKGIHWNQEIQEAR